LGFFCGDLLDYSTKKITEDEPSGPTLLEARSKGYIALWLGEFKKTLLS
jgi:hypothetical protein